MVRMMFGLPYVDQCHVDGDEEWVKLSFRIADEAWVKSMMMLYGEWIGLHLEYGLAFDGRSVSDISVDNIERSVLVLRHREDSFTYRLRIQLSYESEAEIGVHVYVLISVQDLGLG
ncbi:Disco-Interacting Protein 2-like C [Manis pentadactyla]|nr:Disco-Interacting Protein 2-like C [Manis pentadactyla]